MSSLPAAGLLLAVTAAAPAAVIDVTYSTPTLDRWVYAFGDASGTRPLAPEFAAIRVPGFDDRDAQVLVGYDTGATIPAGRGPSAYRVTRAVLTARIAEDETFAYDPTFDALATYLDPSDPAYLPDSDPGARPAELYAAGYRNGWTLQTFQESSPFGGVPDDPPAGGARNVFAANFDDNFTAVDISRNVRQKFEVTPAAIGRNDALRPGQLVPAETDLAFDVNVADPDIQRYLAESLNAGRVNLIISGLHQAEQGGPLVYPVYYTKESIFGTPARLRLVVSLCAADWNGDGVLDSDDFFDFLNAFYAGSADFNGDGVTDSDDFFDFLNAFYAGC